MQNIHKMMLGIDDSILDEILGAAEGSMVGALGSKDDIPEPEEPSGEGKPDVEDDIEGDDDSESLIGDGADPASGDISPEDMELLKALYAQMG